MEGFGQRTQRPSFLCFLRASAPFRLLFSLNSESLAEPFRRSREARPFCLCCSAQVSASKLSGYRWLLATFAGTICLSPFSVHADVGVGIGFAVEAPIGSRFDLDGGCPLGELEGICKKLCFYMDHPSGACIFGWTPVAFQSSLQPDLGPGVSRTRWAGSL